MTDDLTRAPCLGRLDVVSKYLISPDVFIDEGETSGPSSSAHASLMKKLERVEAEKEELKRRLVKNESQEVEPEADSVEPDVETLQDVEKKLSPLDKIVQLRFDFTNNQVLYSRVNDTIIGCNYVAERKKTTYAYRTVLVFAVRSLATPFNMIISSHPSTRSNLVSKAAKDIGFYVPALVCDRNTAYIKAVHALPAGVVLIYDYLHLLRRYKAIIEKTTTKLCAKRDAVLTVSERYSGEVMQLFNDTTPARE
uniref:Uncharacterized protein n=1 Tax=Glossina palpalis gambiensis TaxID=67801 RepID=A0A1B0C2T2_9MUSC